MKPNLDNMNCCKQYKFYRGIDALIATPPQFENLRGNIRYTISAPGLVVRAIKFNNMIDDINYPGCYKVLVKSNGSYKNIPAIYVSHGIFAWLIFRKIRNAVNANLLSNRGK